MHPAKYYHTWIAKEIKDAVRVWAKYTGYDVVDEAEGIVEGRIDQLLIPLSGNLYDKERVSDGLSEWFANWSV